MNIDNTQLLKLHKSATQKGFTFVEVYDNKNFYHLRHDGLHQFFGANKVRDEITVIPSYNNITVLIGYAITNKDDLFDLVDKTVVKKTTKKGK